MPDFTRLDDVRARRPLVHCISNIVSANDCANVVLAAGAGPIMAHAPEEMAAIRPVLDEETLSSYIPGLSDPIKYSFHTPAFDEDRGSFLRAWIKVGLRNKKIYVDAFLNTTESFWYPNAGGEYLEFMCFDIEEENPAYPHVQMHPLNQTFYRYYTAIGTDAAFREIPLLRELLSMGFYFFCRLVSVLCPGISKAFVDSSFLYLYGNVFSGTFRSASVCLSGDAGGAHTGVHNGVQPEGME